MKDYETKNEDGETVIYCGTIDNEGRMHGCGRAISEGGHIEEGQYKHGK